MTGSRKHRHVPSQLKVGSVFKKWVFDISVHLQADEPQRSAIEDSDCQISNVTNNLGWHTRVPDAQLKLDGRNSC